METVEIIAGCWEILFLFYLLIVGRLSYIISPVLYTYYLDERIEWNENINPVKLKIYLILFLLASCLILFSYQSFTEPKPLFDIRFTFIVDSVAFAGIYFFLENKIRTPSKENLNNCSNEINDIILVSSVINDQNNILLEDVKKIDNSFSFTNEEIKRKHVEALENKLFDCELSVFKTFILLEEPIEKLIWKPVADSGHKNRQLLFDYINDLFPNQILTRDRNESVTMINKYFEFNEIGHPKKEKEVYPKLIGDWMKKK